MFPKSKIKQQGAALIVAIFIIIVMSLLAAILTRLLTTSSQASVDEVYGIRALHAANSGAQIFLRSLYPQPDGVESNQCSVQSVQFQTSALANCQASISCTERTYADYNTSIFRITSQGACSVGNLQYSRTVVLEVTNEN